MRTSQKKALLIIGIMALFSIVNFFIPATFEGGKYLILLGLVLGVVYYLIGVDFTRKSNDLIILRNILIYVATYYLVTYLSGLFIGFARTIYNYSFTSLVVNIIPSILSIIAVEIIRGELIYKTNKSRLVVVLSCLVFILFEVSIEFSAYDLGMQENLYQFFGLLLIPSIAKNALMSIIHIRTDKYPAIIYRLSIETVSFLLLIEPDTGPYIKSVLLILLPILIGMMILNMEKKVQTSPEKTKKSKRTYSILIVILLILVLVNSGMVKYQTLVIGSNSMKDYMEKGDVILIKHTNNSEELNKGDILAFMYDNKVITHRIVLKDYRDGDYYYKTKGDNNEKEDAVLITKSMIKGKVLGRVKYIGLPSVWLSELFK
ncbi:MAG: signal peptidase I [Bacilli bacterium]|nr:signal peptidase I [Bacilli bacterium]